MARFRSSFGRPNEKFISRLSVLLKNNVTPLQFPALVPCTNTEVEGKEPPDCSLKCFGSAFAKLTRAKQQIFPLFANLSCDLGAVSFGIDFNKLPFSGQKNFRGIWRTPGLSLCSFWSFCHLSNVGDFFERMQGYSVHTHRHLFCLSP